MMVAVHNPANLALNVVQIAVPHGNFAVQKLDVESGNMVDAAATVLCDMQNQETPGLPQVNNCQMYVKLNVLPGQVSFISLTFDASIDIAV